MATKIASITLLRLFSSSYHDGPHHRVTRPCFPPDKHAFRRRRFDSLSGNLRNMDIRVDSRVRPLPP